MFALNPEARGNPNVLNKKKKNHIIIYEKLRWLPKVVEMIGCNGSERRTRIQKAKHWEKMKYLRLEDLIGYRGKQWNVEEVVFRE